MRIQNTEPLALPRDIEGFTEDVIGDYKIIMKIILLSQTKLVFMAFYLYNTSQKRLFRSLRI